MASKCCITREGRSGVFNSEWRNNAQLVYRLEIDTSSDQPPAAPGNAVRLWNMIDVIEHGQSLVAVPDVLQPIPKIWDAYDSLNTNNYLYADTFSVSPVSARDDVFMITVGFITPQNGDDRSDSPLDWPAKYSIEYQEVERRITEARNIIALPGGNGEGGNRPADTLGPITNAAGAELTETPMDRWRYPVWVIERNYETLDQILALNDTYQWTTNSDSPNGVPVRSLKYLLTEAGAKNESEGIKYYPGITRIEVQNTTDLYVPNTGYRYLDTNDKLTIEDRNGNEITEPINLGTDGKWSDQQIRIGWRYLTETAYTTLVS